MIGLLLAASLAAAAPSGWRNDGTGRWPAAAAPTRWDAGSLAWSAPLPDWSNASPVPWGALVCACVEPVTVVCVEAATGRERFRVAHPVVDAVEPARRAAVAAEVAEAEALEAEVERLKQAYGALLRDARRTGRTADAAEAQALADRLEAARGRLEAVGRWRTPPDQGIVGWSAPTPVADGGRLAVLFANGVVAAHALDGRVLWRRWLGERPTSMLGYDGGGHASSPVVAGGVLVVPYGHLTGLDPATGAVRWRHEAPWRHYGTPAVARVGGRELLVTPDGSVVRPSDGAVLRSELADAWYVGPVVDGDTAYFVDARADAAVREHGGLDVHAVRLHAEGDGVRAEPLWRVTVAVKETIYAAPTLAEGRLWLVTHGGGLVVLDAATGAVRGRRALDELAPYKVFPSPAVAAGRLYVVNELGTTVVLTLADAPEVVAVNRLEPMRTSPAFDGARMYLRTKDRLVAVPVR